MDFICGAVFLFGGKFIIVLLFTFNCKIYCVYNCVCE